jgi:trk system potassium uptake protein TrkH
VTILAGTVLLLLPFTTTTGHISLIDALFTATSGVCVTGLIVQDTATYFTPVGQIIILILIQLGGLGIMTFSTLVLIAAGRRISIKDRIILQQGLHHTAPSDIKSIIKRIFFYTMAIELAGILSFFFRFHKEYSWLKALYHSLFHSISAFCNAGFSLFSDSFASYRNDIWLNATLMILIVLGGLGFLVIDELRCGALCFLKKEKAKISLHTKLILTLTLFLILFSFVFFLFIEWNQSLESFSLKEKGLSSLFQVITPRTAGFNTMDMSSLSFAMIFLLMMLMFVGASPGSTGGGVKTSTVGVIAAFLRSKIRARESVNLFYRTLPLELVMRAFTVVTLSVSIIFLSSFILLLTQAGTSMKEVLFEVFSAFGTVGLSLGLTPKLTALGKLIVVLTMYIGRIGPLTLLYAFSREKAYGRFEYVEETVMIG